MSNRIKTFWLGIFILACVALLAWLLLFLRPSVGDNAQVLRVRFSNIEKIAIGTRVTFAGKAVGEVTEINEVCQARQQRADINGSPFFYELVLKLDSHVHVYSCDDILFSTSGLLGEKIIAIIPKVASKNCPNPEEITDQILYARSTDKLQESIDKLVDVAVSFDATLALVSRFIEENSADFHVALKSLTSTSEAVGQIAVEAKESNLITHLGHITKRLHEGEGSLGRLINEEEAYNKMLTTMSHFDMLINTINQYGLLFQFDTNWQKLRRRQHKKMESLCTPCDYYNYFNNELFYISLSLDRIAQVQKCMEYDEMKIDNPCLTEKFDELLNRVKALEADLELHMLNN